MVIRDMLEGFKQKLQIALGGSYKSRFFNRSFISCMLFMTAQNCGRGERGNFIHLQTTPPRRETGRAHPATQNCEVKFSTMGFQTNIATQLSAITTVPREPEEDWRKRDIIECSLIPSALGLM
jgi:hypothetical protein